MPKSPHFTPTASRRIEILAFPDVQLLDVAGPLQVFATANDHARAAGHSAPYAVRVVADATVRSSAGLGLVADALPDALTDVDTLVVAGGFGVNAAVANESLLAWVTARAQAARRIASVCSGAFLLAAAGLLDGRRAVTHWSRCAELARRYPKVTVEPDPIFIADGQVWTSAGITAGIDLALALVEADLGHAMALTVARLLVVFLKRPGGQAQYSAALALQSNDAAFDALHGWMADNLQVDLSLPMLAQAAGMSERTFVRRYRAATGLTPARAVEHLRVEAARRLLGSDATASIKRVATRCGFGSEETLRRSFARLLGTTPQDYRARFAAADD